MVRRLHCMLIVRAPSYKAGGDGERGRLMMCVFERGSRNFGDSLHSRLIRQDDGANDLGGFVFVTPSSQCFCSMLLRRRKRFGDCRHTVYGEVAERLVVCVKVDFNALIGATS